jgi:hypothetical protein
MFRALEGLLLDPYPHRTLYIALVKRLGLYGYERRVALGAVDRPHYAHCLYQGARLAKRLGHRRVSALEFGVARGKGLLSLERHAEAIERSLGIAVEIYGFDTGEGLPPPEDYRDLPYYWKSGQYRMEVDKLRRRLRSAKLILGDIRKTGADFLAEHDPAPIAAAMVDVDYYSSTMPILDIFRGIPDRYVLPRAFFYFDDVRGTDAHLYSDHTGERLAIREFNDSEAFRKFSPAYYLLTRKVVQPWSHSIYVLHSFKHADYCRFVEERGRYEEVG